MSFYTGFVSGTLLLIIINHSKKAVVWQQKEQCYRI